MADTASIARPYAKALFDLAKQEASFEAWSIALDALAGVAANDDFAALVNDPKVSSEQLVTLMQDLLGDTLPTDGANLINLLVSNGRTSALPDIQTQFEQLVAKEQASVNAQVITARSLSSAQRHALQAALQSRLGLKVSLEEQVDESLIGGAIVRAGDLVIDGSAKGRLEKLTTALMR